MEEPLFGRLVAQGDGSRPVTRVRHLYLGERPGEVVRDVTAEALSTAADVVTTTHGEMVEACATGRFETREGPLCDWCSFKSSCPAFGGDLQALLATGRRRPKPSPAVDEDQQTLDEALGLVAAAP